MNKARVKGVTSNRRRSSTYNLKVISFFTALLVVITALLGLFVAWADLMSQGNSGELVV